MDQLRNANVYNRFPAKQNDKSRNVLFSGCVEYQISVLPGNIPTLSVEATAEHGWHRFSHAQIGMTRFGASAPGNELFEKFGFSTANVTQKGKALVDFYKTAGSVPDLMCRPFFNNIQGVINH